MSPPKYRTWVLLAACITLHIVVSRASDKHSSGPGYSRLVKRGTSEPEPSDAEWYYKWYESSPPAARPFVFIGLLLMLSLLFSCIGITASDFFCPNLSTIASYLGLNESTAGVTFLAFGNGSPDVFSTFSALKGDSFGLAIGELIGAATFIISIVVGTIALIRPFHVPRHAFIRDVTFFTAASVLLIAVLHDGHMNVIESGALVLLYALYVTVVVVGNWYTRRRKTRETKNAVDWIHPQADHNATGAAAAANLQAHVGRVDDGSSLHSAHSMSPHSSRSASPISRSRRGSRLYSHHDDSIDTPRANFSLLGAVEFRDVVRQLRRESESVNNSPAGASENEDYFGDSVGHIYGHHRRVASVMPSSLSRKTSGSGRPRAVSYTAGPLPDAEVSGDTTANDQSLNPWATQQSCSSHDNNLLSPGTRPRPSRPRVKIPENNSSRRVPSISITDPSGLVDEIPVTGEPRPLTPPIANESRFHIRKKTRRVLGVLFPSMQNFQHKSLVGQFLATISALPILALTLTLPVVDDGSQEGGVALPVSDSEPLDEELGGIALDEDAGSDAESDRLVTANVGEELHHLVEGGFSALHSPLGRFSHSALRKMHGQVGSDYGSEMGDDEIGKELLCELQNEEALEFHKWLTAAQCVCSPAWVVLVMFGGNDHFTAIMLASVVVGLVAGAGVATHATDGSSKPWRLVRCFAGFVCSMVWIAAIADQVVDVLQAVGEILGLSDAIIGLTIFAVGNSLADLVANVTVAQFAPAMAYAACFGGPMLNILLGIGGSGTYLMLAYPSKSPVSLHFSPTLWVSASGLIVMVVATAIFVPLNGYLIDRRWAVGLIVGYCTLMTINVLVEIKTGRHGGSGGSLVPVGGI